MTLQSVVQNLERVRADIAKVQAAEGIGEPVTIVAVTKGHGPEVVRAAWEAGIPDVGENRVQDALDKQHALSSMAIRWHLIGHLQTNKAKLVPDRFARVHSVDSWRVAEALESAVSRRGSGRLSVLLQVNMAEEQQKSGCTPEEAGDLAQRIAALPNLRLDGLMTMAPFTDDERVQRSVFSGLRRLRDRIAATGVAVPELSMGMSGDYRAAVAEGATVLRLGTILFGDRQ